MSEIEELRKELQDLKTQVSVLSKKILDVDDSISNHIGLDWGETLSDANSPHPNASFNTMESGGGAIRQDAHGMQVATSGTTRAAIYFVDELEPNPSLADPVQVSISGRANDSNGQSLLSMQAIDLDPPTAPVAAGQIYVTTTGSDVGRAGILVYVDSDLTGTGEWSELILNRVDTEAAGSLQLYKALLRLCPSQAANFPFTSDPANAIEGDIWYNTTDNKYKGVDALATKAFLMEGDVVGQTVKVKEADETVTTNTTLQNDDELLFAVAANEVWQFEGVLSLSAPTAADFKMTFTGPAGAVGSFSVQYDSPAQGADIGASGALGESTSLALSIDGASLRFWGGIHNGSTAGNLTLQWAQDTSSGSTTVRAGSYIKYQLANV